MRSQVSYNHHPCRMWAKRSSREEPEWDKSHFLAFAIEGRGLEMCQQLKCLLHKHENLNLDLWQPHKTQLCHWMPIISAQGRWRLEHSGITQANTHTHWAHAHTAGAHIHMHVPTCELAHAPTPVLLVLPYRSYIWKIFNDHHRYSAYSWRM